MVSGAPSSCDILQGTEGAVFCVIVVSVRKGDPSVSIMVLYIRKKKNEVLRSHSHHQPRFQSSQSSCSLLLLFLLRPVVIAIVLLACTTK